jgi:hypothetical protein
MSAIFDRFLTGLTGSVFVAETPSPYLVEASFFDRFDRFDRFFSHTHMKKENTNKSQRQPKNALNLSNPSKPVKRGAWS